MRIGGSGGLFGMKPEAVSKVAKRCGVSRAAVYAAIDDGRCPAITVNNVRKIDLHDPLVKAYMRDTIADKQQYPDRGKRPDPPIIQTKIDSPAKSPKQQYPVPDPPIIQTKIDSPAKSPKQQYPFPVPPIIQTKIDPPARSPKSVPNIPEIDNFMPSEVVSSGRDLKRRKALADAELQEIKAKLKAEEYFEKIGALVDLESLRRKMGKFTDVLITDLLYFPEEIADQLWLRAKAAGEKAPTVIREILSDRLTVIVEEAKRAARGVVPEDRDRRYSVIDEK